jgi:hypothetical protein
MTVPGPGALEAVPAWSAQVLVIFQAGIIRSASPPGGLRQDFIQFHRSEGPMLDSDPLKSVPCMVTSMLLRNHAAVFSHALIGPHNRIPAQPVLLSG